MSEDIDLVRALKAFQDNPTEVTWAQLLPYVTETAEVRAEPSPRRLFDYWGPRGFALDYPMAPSLDYYRLVDNDDEAQAAIAAGEKPLHGHRGMSPDALSHQQLLQWEGPNRLFAVDWAGRAIELHGEPGGEDEDAPDLPQPFVPLWNSEGFPTGNPEDRQRLLDYLNRISPDLLHEIPANPAALQPTSGLPPLLGTDLAAALAGPRLLLPAFGIGGGAAPLARVAQASRAQSGKGMYDDAMMRWRERIPSFREEQIGPPEILQPEPMPRITPWESGPTTPPDMPMLPPPPPLEFRQPQSERVDLGYPLWRQGIA